MARDYPYKRAFGPNDMTLDLDPLCKPDFLQDARNPFPLSLSTNGSGLQDFWAGISHRTLHIRSKMPHIIRLVLKNIHLQINWQKMRWMFCQSVDGLD